MNNDIKRLLTSPDPETIFLGLMIMCENKCLNLRDLSSIRTGIWNIRDKNLEFFQDKKKILTELYEEIIFNLIHNG